MSKVKITMVICLLLETLGLCAQQQASRRICDTIHYESVHGKIIIPVTVNGVEVKYIVDTGGQTGTDWKHVKEMGGKATGASNPISDLNGKKQLYQIAEVKDVHLSEEYCLPSMRTMVLPQIGGFEDLGVAGILGGDAFAQTVLTFDAAGKIMVINHPYRPNHLKLSDGVEMFPGRAEHSIIEVEIGGVRKKVLFDTGASGFLLLGAGDFAEIGSAQKEILMEGFGINGVGLEGLSKPEPMSKINVKEMSVCGKRFNNAGSIISGRGLSIVGVELLEYGKVIIDYMRDRFFFFPYDEGPTDLGGPARIWNVEVLPANGHFEVTTVWDSLKGKLEFGEQVVDINGTDITGFPLSQPEIEKVFDAIAGDSAYIVVLRDGNRVKVEIRKE